ncbi:MAG: methyltransferase domain-containing protein [Acidobacteria bacterium]|nr:methyltransferase domain-containing protein [Acidobacteriota bacterium]
MTRHSGHWQRAAQGTDFHGPTYAQYLSTPEGRLRFELAWSNLVAHLPQQEEPLHVLDAGCGTGDAAVQLASLGHRVCLLDFSQEMLEQARLKIVERNLMPLASFHLAPIEATDQLFLEASFDVILCHTVLEYVLRPRAALAVLVSRLRPGGLLSLLFRNRHGEVLRLALIDQQLAAAKERVRAREFRERLFGLKGHLLTAEQMRRWWNRLGMRIIAHYGVRVLSDYLPLEAKSDEAQLQQLIELEQTLGSRTPFKQIARYVQMLGVKE